MLYPAEINHLLLVLGYPQHEGESTIRAGQSLSAVESLALVDKLKAMKGDEDGS